MADALFLTILSKQTLKKQTLRWALHTSQYPTSKTNESGGRSSSRTARNNTLVRDLTNLLSCFYTRRDQADIVHPRLMTKVDDFGDLAEVEVLIALDEHNLFLAR